MNKGIMQLTPQEEEVMKLIWQMAPTDIRRIIPKLENPDTPYTTVASTARNLELKGYITKTGKSRGFIYAPLITEEQYSEHTVQRVVKDFFTGSYKQLVQNFAEESKISAIELREIIRLIEESDHEDSANGHHHD